MNRFIVNLLTCDSGCWFFADGLEILVQYDALAFNVTVSFLAKLRDTFRYLCVIISVLGVVERPGRPAIDRY